jgi:hypothetical protein
MEIDVAPVRSESRLIPILAQILGIVVLMRLMSIFNVLTSLVNLALASVRFGVAAITAAVSVMVALVPMALMAGLTTRLIQLINDYRRELT